MAELSRADIQQQYLHNVVLWKGLHVKVNDVRKDKTVSLIDVKTSQFLEDVAFNQKDFKAPNFRLGMCTMLGRTAYITRIPVRKMGIGLSSDNIRITVLGDQERNYAFLDNICSLIGEPVYSTFIGKYPDLSTAFTIAKAHLNGIVAFDRQLAVDSKANIFYKDKQVGKYVTEAKVPPFIAFSKRYSFLDKILGCNYETTI